MPAIDFSSHDPDFSEAQIKACERIIQSVKQLNSQVVRLNGSEQELSAAADQIDSLLKSIAPVTESRGIETFPFKFDREDPINIMPFNPATGEFNPISPQLNMKVEGEELVTECVFSNCYESAPDTVQGGMISAVFDQALAFAVMIHGKTGPTLWLKVNYLKPTPINKPVTFRCKVESIDGKKFMVKGTCISDSVVVSEAEALMLGAYDIPIINSKD